MKYEQLFEKTDKVVTSCKTKEQMVNALKFVKLVDLHVGEKVNQRPYFNWLIGLWYGYALGRFDLGLNIKHKAL